MRFYILSAVLAAALVFAGFAAAFVLFTPEESGANTTWQTESFTALSETDGAFRPAYALIDSLPSECQVDFEVVGFEAVIVAYACP